MHLKEKYSLQSHLYIYTSNVEGKVITKNNPSYCSQTWLICIKGKCREILSMMREQEGWILKAVRGDADNLWLHSIPVTAEEPGCPPVAIALRY